MRAAAERMADLVVIFRTPSHIEADVVKGLLETHGIKAIVTSEIKISILIDETQAETAVRALHTAFGLDKGA